MAQKIPSSPTKKTTETYQRPKKESVARKTNRIEKEENTVDKLGYNIEIKNDNGNAYNESHDNQQIDENNDYESEETNSLSEESEMN